MGAAETWNADGTNFTFHLRCFDFDTDISMIHRVIGEKKLLLISDIRGVVLLKDGMSFDKAEDQDLQWRAIRGLKPVSSLVKFTIPNWWSQFYYYAPGILLKQVFTFFGSCELRLMIEGAPEHGVRYNAWELCEKMLHHHDSLRGQVYKTIVARATPEPRSLGHRTGGMSRKP